jgi:hypothetical protein
MCTGHRCRICRGRGVRLCVLEPLVHLASGLPLNEAVTTTNIQEEVDCLAGIIRSH